jgi:hypothetical protein
MNRFVFAVKLYIKALGKLDLMGWVFSTINLAIILFLATFIISKHGSGVEAAQFASTANDLFYLMLAIPFFATAVGLLLRSGLKSAGYDVEGELWPEVKL